MDAVPVIYGLYLMKYKICTYNLYRSCIKCVGSDKIIVGSMIRLANKLMIKLLKICKLTDLGRKSL